MSDDLKTHLEEGCTTVARAWLITRTDGAALGFTDHDVALTFDGNHYQPETGLTARAFAQTTGLSVDNTEAFGALSSEAITEADIAAGRYDDAEVVVWLVNWADTGQRRVLFRGHMGEVTRASGAFAAELRGLAEALNQEQGRIYHPSCSAVLGDGMCRADLSVPGMRAEVALQNCDGATLTIADLGSYDDGWFTHGLVEVLSGAAQGLSGMVRADRLLPGGTHRVELWQALGAALSPGDRLRLTPGCDRNAETCRFKFNNFMNFRGFPHIPGEDWLMAVPSKNIE